jgi:hypothetical protein
MANEPSDIRPPPPPLHWTRRIAKASLVTLLLLILVRFVWGWDARRRLDAAIRHCRSFESPLLAVDFQRPRLPDDQNAAALLLDAGRTFHYVYPSGDNFDINTATADQLTAIRESLRYYARVLAAIRRACALDADWTAAYADPVRALESDDLASLRGAAAWAGSAGRIAARDGDHRDAVECARDILGVARAAYARPYWHSYNVANQIDTRGASDILALAPTLRVAFPPADRDLSPQQVRDLIDELLDERAILRGSARALQSERLLILAYFRAVRSGRTGHVYQFDGGYWPMNSAQRRMIRIAAPMLDSRAAQALRYLTDAAEAIKQPNYRAARAVQPFPAWRSHSFEPLDTLEDALPHLQLEEGIDTGFESHSYTLAVRRTAAISLAIRLYRHDNDNRMPPHLVALVPSYLPQIPIDPFAADGSYLRFTGSMIYSIGPDGIDSGSTALRPRLSPPLRWRHIVFELKP